MKPDIQNAITIFTAVRDTLGPKYLAYWVTPNTVLTLSGARAYCNGVFWEVSKGQAETWEEEIKASAEVVVKATAALWSDVGVLQADGDRYASYELITQPGLRYVLANTALVKVPDGFTARQEVLQELVADLKAKTAFKDYSDDSLHHMAFGILLGYPDKAITESVFKWEEDDPFAEPLIEADIRGAGYYTCPQPGYSYPRHLIGDSAITANEQLWSALLKEYYTSDFHQLLAKDPAFQQKIKELGIER